MTPEKTPTEAHYDVIVVGAGPAGNTAARELALGGARVALLERHLLPRHKTCGGGMPMTAGQILQMDPDHSLPPDAFVETVTTEMRHTWHFNEAVVAPLNPPANPGDAPPERIALWMVQRSIFDYALTLRATAAGAELKEGLTVRSAVTESGGRVRVRAEGVNGAWQGTCDRVIGSDGANGSVARLAGLRPERSLAIAIEAEVPHRWGDGHPDLRREVCHLEYGIVPRGYAWVFPKKDHINVGAGVIRPRRDEGRGNPGVRRELQKAIQDYLAALEVPRRLEELNFHAHPLPLWNGMDRLQSADDRILLTGDAAGLVNPLFGDGILHALKSGRIAAQSILAGEPEGYTQRMEAEFRANFDSALQMSRFFYQWPRLCFSYGVTRPGASRLAARLLCGEALFTDVAGRAVRRLRRSMVSPPSNERSQAAD